ncbi:aldo/keto reductase [Uliginosibacterium sp. H1]|uniref:aldo/keto reductase n=1 Tax=Uliginosibacterium sp. H1 TaxID=3114757 RepID=UPI002E1856D3|nr:aldo/keto reductase [Uliginosibacterium sp. H1]
MQYRPLGRSGLHVSVVGLGCNNFGLRATPENARAVIHKAIDVGVTFFDTADVYGNKGGSETLIGETLGARRQEVVLATKFGMPMNDGTGPTRKSGASRRYILDAVEASLKRLQTDWIDLYQLHRPDHGTPWDETLRALDQLVRDGKVRYIGASNLSAWQVVETQWLARELGTERFISEQDEYSLLKREAERELIPALAHHGVGLLPYWPLADGLLTGKYGAAQPLPEGSRLQRDPPRADRILTERNLRIVAALDGLAKAHGRSLLELAFSWLAAQPQVGSVIAGATRPEQVEQNARAADWVLDAATLARIDSITRA